MHESYSQFVTSLGAVFLAVPWILLFGLPLIALIGIPICFLFNMMLRSKEKETKILVVDDDESSVLSLLSILSQKKAQVHFVKSGRAMIEQLKESEYDLLFVDRQMPEQTGDEALKVADAEKLNKKNVPVVFFTGIGPEQNFILPKLFHFRNIGVWGKQTPYQALDHRVSKLIQKFG